MSKGDLRCIEGRLWRHDPQRDDPYLETDVGKCPECDGNGCADEQDAGDETGEQVRSERSERATSNSPRPDAPKQEQ